MPKAPSIQPQDKYVIRLPDGMRDRLKAAAETNNRSMNAEIVARLQLTFDVDDVPKDRDTILSEAIKLMNEATKTNEYYAEIIEWMRDQQALSIGLIEAIVKADGKLSPEFLDSLKLVLATKGMGVDFPKAPDTK